MWTIVCFIKENCVEIVPEFWFKNDLCAWPKKNVQKHVKFRTNPNEIEFTYYKARALSKDIESLQEARAKLIRAQETSELSSYENDKSTRRNRHQMGISEDDSDDDYQKMSFNRKTKNSKKNFKNEATSQSAINDPPMFQIQNNDVDSSNEEINDDKDKNDDPTTGQALYDIINDTFENTQDIILASKSVSISPAGKRNVTSTKKEEISMSSRKKLDFNHTPSRTYDYKQKSNSSTRSLKKCFSSTDAVDSHQATYNNTKTFVHLSQSSSFSPLKSPNPPLSLKLKTDQNSNKSRKQHQESNQIAHLIDTVHKLIRTTSNLRFEIRELAKKIDTVDQKVTDTIANTRSEVLHESNNLFDESSWDLPLATIEDLELFEEKLSDKLFRKKVINELSRYERSSVAETTRQITSKIFHNNLLAQFSYQGQKHKRVFSVLNSCSVIFSTVRSIKKYNCCPDIDISKPLKVYMANAKAREENKQKKLTTISNESNSN